MLIKRSDHYMCNKSTFTFIHLFTVSPEAACGNLDETHTNFTEEKTQM